MSASSIQVLVAEDYPPFRRYLVSNLHSEADFQVVCEVADGSEAVQKARELQPDLILLDIGLPSLNGIEAARRIRSVSPTSKILFVSENQLFGRYRRSLAQRRARLRGKVGGHQRSASGCGSRPSG